MKNYSSHNVSRSDIDAIDAKQTEELNKQAAQIQKLRTWLAAAFAINLLVAVGAYFF